MDVDPMYTNSQLLDLGVLWFCFLRQVLEPMSHGSWGMTIFRCSSVGCVYIHDYFTLLMNWSHYHCTVIFYLLSWSLFHLEYRTHALSGIPLTWSIFFHPITLSLCVFLNLKWILSRQLKVVYFFFLILSVILCLLFREFNPFTFRVIINRNRFTNTIF